MSASLWLFITKHGRRSVGDGHGDDLGLSVQGVQDQLGGSPGADAVGAVRVALRDAAFYAVYGPDGRDEHEPLAVVQLPAATVVTFGAAVAEPARAGDGDGVPVVADAVEEFAAEWHPSTSLAALAEVAARLHDVRDHAWGLDPGPSPHSSDRSDRSRILAVDRLRNAV